MIELRNLTKTFTINGQRSVVANNINAIRASGVLHNLHVKWQNSDCEEDTPSSPPTAPLLGGNGDSSDNEDSDDDVAAATSGQRVVDPNSSSKQKPDSALSLEQVKELGKQHRDMIMGLMGESHHSMDPMGGMSSRHIPSSSSSQ